jgi:hypothetical protein
VHSQEGSTHDDRSRYFNMSARLDTASWSTAEEDALSPCGHCDNCLRSPAKPNNVTLEAWQILTIAEAVKERHGRVTLAQLATVARGNGKGEFGVVSHGRGKASKSALDTKTLIGTPMKLSQDVRPCDRCLYLPHLTCLLDRKQNGCAFSSSLMVTSKKHGQRPLILSTHILNLAINVPY